MSGAARSASSADCLLGRTRSDAARGWSAALPRRGGSSYDGRTHAGAAGRAARPHRAPACNRAWRCSAATLACAGLAQWNFPRRASARSGAVRATPSRAATWRWSGPPADRRDAGAVLVDTSLARAGLAGPAHLGWWCWRRWSAGRLAALPSPRRAAARPVDGRGAQRRAGAADRLARATAGRAAPTRTCAPDWAPPTSTSPAWCSRSSIRTDGTYALRAVAAVIGTVGVAALAALAWMLYGARVAVVATAWLAVSQYHLNYSRWGEMPIMSSVVETLGWLALVVGLGGAAARAGVGLLAAGVAGRRRAVHLSDVSAVHRPRRRAAALPARAPAPARAGRPLAGAGRPPRCSPSPSPRRCSHYAWRPTRRSSANARERR